MADKIVVLRSGVVEQIGAPLTLYDRPANVFVAGFIGSPAMNLMDVATEGGQLRLFTDYTVPLPEGVRADARMTFGLRPDHILAHEAQVPGAFAATVTSYEATGSETMLFAEKEGRALTVVTKERLHLATGQPVWLLPDLTRAHFFGADGVRAN